MKSVMSHNFSQVPSADIARSTFKRDNGVKTTFDAGELIPIYIDEVLPGDTFNVKMASFARLSTPLVPIMDNLFMETHFFCVPVRLVWDNWQKFNGEQIDPGDSTDYLIPQIAAPVAGFALHSVYDHLGIPINITGFNISALPLRAHNLIWNEWFRDQNLQDSLPVPKGDGPDADTLYTIKRRGKRHDYFTSALPWAQKGPAVTLPLGTVAPVYMYSAASTIPTPNKSALIRNSATDATTAGTNALNSFNGSLNIGGGGGANQKLDPNGTLYTDLNAATSATINSLRLASQIQRLYERDARGGTRYTEVVRCHFGVVSPDARLQRPEYLGGGSTRININPIAQTSSTDATTPQGNLAAIGTASATGHGFTKSFTEHCILLGYVSVRADLNYQQGVNRMWSRRTRWDFFWPDLAQIGEQTILNKEIYVTGTSTDSQAFGYQERYAEYRYKPSTITGLFRSAAPGSLDYWHLAQQFGSLPVLNDSFIQDNPPVDRISAVPSEPNFILDTFFSETCARPLPMYGVPGISRF